MYVDNFDYKEGPEANIILTFPEGHKMSHVLRFKFHANNNKTEYEP